VLLKLQKNVHFRFSLVVLISGFYLSHNHLFLDLLYVLLCWQNEALNVADDGISAALPDLCIVYKLHLECGKLINLYDWMQVCLQSPVINLIDWVNFIITLFVVYYYIVYFKLQLDCGQLINRYDWV